MKTSIPNSSYKYRQDIVKVHSQYLQDIVRPKVDIVESKYRQDIGPIVKVDR